MSEPFAVAIGLKLNNCTSSEFNYPLP